MTKTIKQLKTDYRIVEGGMSVKDVGNALSVTTRTVYNKIKEGRFTLNDLKRISVKEVAKELKRMNILKENK